MSSRRGDPSPGAPYERAPDDRPRATVIIPHLNTPELLVRALQSVSRQRIDHGWFEIIVVDNGSRDPLSTLQAAWPEVRFLAESEPGPGPARNLGARHARADILAFIDADVQVLPGWLQAGIDALAEFPDGPLGGDVRIHVRDPRALAPVEAFECVFSFRQRNYIERKQYSVTANLMMTRDIFERAGPFGGIDTAEDREFGQRAHRLGMPTRYVPAMRALHPPRRDFAEMRQKWQRLSHQALTLHTEAGGSLLRWRARAVAVAISGIAHMPRVLLSDRISGAGNRMRGIGFLLRIRWARAIDMLQLAGKAQDGANIRSFNWNR